MLKEDEIAALLDSIPASTPLELRDRAIFELAYATGLRAEELTTLDIGDADFDAEELRVHGKGGKERVVPIGEQAWRALNAYLERGRPLLAREGNTGERAIFLSKSGRRLGTADLRRRLRGWTQRAGHAAGDDAAHASALVRDPSAGGRGRSSDDPGAARARDDQHYADIHSGRVATTQEGVRTCPPACVTGASTQGKNILETNVKAIELKDLWRRYKDDGDDRARERLVLAYSPLVKYVAGRMSSGLPAHVEDSDLISYGLLGLISAIERFDTSRDIKFETFAIARIKGSIIDELRSLDWVPRSVRARARQIEKTNATLEHKLRRAPTDQEMAEALGTSVDDFQESLTKISNSSVVALDELWTVSDASGDQVSLLDTIQDPNAIDPAQEMDAGEMKDRLAEAIARLPEREKLVVALYYYENLTLREIGEVLGVTESRVSQLHTKAVLRLKSRLQAEPSSRPTRLDEPDRFSSSTEERSLPCRTRHRTGSATWL